MTQTPEENGQHTVLPDAGPIEHELETTQPQVTALYGLTPKVEAAILEALEANQPHRVRLLVSPLHPADQADLLERVGDGRCAVLVEMLGDTLDPEVMAYLDEEVLEVVLDTLGPVEIAKALPELDSDDAAQIAAELEPEELDEVLQAMPVMDRRLVEEALSYPEDSAGRLMQREIVTVPPFWTVGQAIDYLRSSDLGNDDFYLIIVTNPQGHPVGEVRLNRLLCAQRPTRISEIMDTDIRLVPASMDQEEVATLFRRYGMVSTAVIDADGRLAGVITLDDVLDVVDEEAEEDLLSLAGVSDGNIRLSVAEILQSRASWLFVNLITAILASLVIGFFEATIEQIVALAILMPIVASMGGNAATQTVTVAVRAIAMREFDPRSATNFMIKELAVGMLNGLIFAMVAMAVCYLWFSSAGVAFVLGAAMMVNLVVAALSGTLVPLGLVRAGVDPAVASSVFITTITDVVGFFVFLGLAALYLL